MTRDSQPTNATLMARCHAAVPRGVGQFHEVCIARGSNSETWDIKIRRYIDYASGIAGLNTGHYHHTVRSSTDQHQRAR